MKTLTLLVCLLFWSIEAAVSRKAKAPLKIKEVGNSTVIPFESECSHNPATVWNDVMFLFDVSEATGKKHLEDMIATFKTLAFSYTIKRAEQPNDDKVMRAGIITYASNVEVISPLGKWNATDIYNWNAVIKQGDVRTDLKGAIQKANAELSGSAHRKSSKPVIVVFATTFNEYGEQSPLTVAQDFISNGGAIITYDYISNDGGDDSMLRKIASDGFALNSKEHTFQDLLYSQCYINCFCPNNYHPFEFGDKHVPSGGCYWPVSSPAMSILAKDRCRHFNNGIVVKVDSIKKEDKLKILTAEIYKYYIGAEWETSHQRWQWPDETELTNYSNWCSGVPDGTDGKQCAFIRKGDSCWTAVDCISGLQYVCQSAPCDSTRYCDLD